MGEVKCIYQGQCSEEGAQCNVCLNNKGKRSHFTPDIVYPPYVPYVPYYPTYPQYTPIFTWTRRVADYITTTNPSPEIT